MMMMIMVVMKMKMTMTVVVVVVMVVGVSSSSSQHDYGEALSKSILFFEGQRSGKLPPTQRLTWRKDSALSDGFHSSTTISTVDLVGGYYDAGDNIKFNFPMAFTTTLLSWSVLEFGESMGNIDFHHTIEAIKWATDYFLKSTEIEGTVFVQVGNPWADHNCWERPEDMDTPRTAYAVTKQNPGSEVSAEIAAALASSSLVFKGLDSRYSQLLLQRAISVFEFADKYRGSYNDSLGPWVCPFYCDFGGYQDELIWGAAWLYKATNSTNYWDYINANVKNLEKAWVGSLSGSNSAEFGWDSKHAGINVLLSKFVMNSTASSSPFLTNADKFICSVLPESPTKSVKYSPGGLLFKQGGSNMQHPTALSFLLLVYARYSNRDIHCDNVVAKPSRLVDIAKGQVDYILGTNPLNMSYMVGYGKKFPQKIHHRGSSLPSIVDYPKKIECKGGSPYFSSNNPNPNILTGAVVGGPYINDSYDDSRADFASSEPTTYINAPLVGLLAYFKALYSTSQNMIE